MKAAAIAIAIAVLLAGGGVGFYFYYTEHLRFTDDFTECPVLRFREAAVSEDAAIAFANEENLVSLAVAEKCSLDCRHGNATACAVYGLAQLNGAFVLESARDASETLRRACERGEAMACQLERRVLDDLEAREKEAASAKAREENASVLRSIQERKSAAGRVMADALEFFGGSRGAMFGAGLTRWYEGTCRYLLYDKPMLSQMHRFPGRAVKGVGLEEFAISKYTGGDQRPDWGAIREFFERFMRLGVMQIKLDYRVEKKKESDLPKRHGFFRAKHTFLYRSAEIELKIIDLVEKDIEYEVGNG